MDEAVQIGIAVAVGIVSIVILGQRLGFLPQAKNRGCNNDSKPVVTAIRDMGDSIAGAVREEGGKTREAFDKSAGEMRKALSAVKSDTAVILDRTER